MKQKKTKLDTIIENSLNEERQQKMCEYRKFYHKNPRSFPSVHRGNEKWICEMLNESSISEIPYAKEKFLCLNDRNNLTNFIRENESEKIIFDEGLTKTYKTEKMVKYAKIFISKNIDSILYDLKISEVFKGENEDIRVVEEIYIKDKDENVKDYISPLVGFMVPWFVEDDVKEFVGKFSKEMYVFGYNVSSIDKIGESEIKQPFRDKKITVLVISFEAKFGHSEAVLNDTFFHVVPIRYIEKIRKNGLVPYSKSDYFDYPDRIYLFNNPEYERLLSYGNKKIRDLRDKKNGMIEDEGFYVIGVSLNDIRNDSLYKSGKIKFYYDPTFDKNDTKDNPIAVFTYTNIPKKFLMPKMAYVKVNEDGVNEDAVGVYL